MPKIDIQKILDASQSNTYPAMMEYQAAHLGVTAGSLRRLGIGWLPIVTFKKDQVNYRGWWTCAERDEHAEPIGVSLRSMNDTKCMYPGSKHGLIYEVNPDHSKGERGYEAGAHNWVRTMDANRTCPICGKPDGCLLSSEDPSDPKAVVCIRTPSAKQLKFGYLHLLKPEAQLASKNALADNNGPVIIVEGMSDATIAMDLGFNSVGRPSNLACMDTLANLVRGRQIIIVGENDRKPDGREPGREGMVAAYQMLRAGCPNIKMVMPPPNVKDLRVWVVNFGLTREHLLDYADKNAQEHVPEMVLKDDRPMAIAEAYLNDTCKLAGRYTVRRWFGHWYKYVDGRYITVDDETFAQPVWLWSADKLTPGKDTLNALSMSNSLAANICSGITAKTLVPSPTMPCWINGAEGPASSDMVVFQNGILHVSSYLSGAANPLLDPTPDLFTTFAVPYDFDPTAVCPKWVDFLRQVLGDDVSKHELLQEWFGYCMIPDTKYHKMMVLSGVPRGGKGTVCHILRHILGGQQCVAMKLDELGETFELESWLNALVAIDDDAHLPASRDSTGVMSMLKGLTGDGFQRIKRKFQEKLSMELKTRLIIAVNELPELPDYMGAIVPRINLVTFQNSFKGRENFDLRYELEPEASGIIIWALDGLRRLRANGRFTLPDSSRAVMQEWSVDMNPLSAFAEECCDEATAGQVGREELFDVWDRWAKERRITSMTRSRFYERIKAAITYPITFDSYEHRGQKISVYRGISVKQWAAKKYLGQSH